MKALYNYKVLLLLMFMICFCLFNANAQQLLNNGTNAKITNTGSIKFLSASASFTNNVANGYAVGTSSGTINFAGNVTGQVFFSDNGNSLATSAYRVPGWVSYTGSGNLNVYGTGGSTPSYYTNLGLAGGSGQVKTFPNTETHVSGVYWVQASSASRNYGTGCASNTFIYDGDAQTIYPESTNSGEQNRYANLMLTTSSGTPVNKSILSGETVYVKYGFGSAANTNLLLDGSNIYVGHDATVCADNLVAGTITLGTTTAGSFNMNSNNITFSGNVSLASASSFVIDGAGNATFNTGTVDISNGTLLLDAAGNANFAANVSVGATGTLRSNDNVAGDINVTSTGTLALATGATLYLGIDNDMNVTGAFTNASGNEANLTFSNGSNVRYLGAGNQSVVATGAANSYANLFVDNGGVKTGQGIVQVRDVYNAGMENNASTTFTFADLTNSYLAMGNGNANYFGISEVIGKMRRANAIDALATATNYTMNNAQTVLAFSTLPTDYVQLDVRPATNPNVNMSPSDGVVVRRKITINTAGTALGEMSLARLAYNPATEFNNYGGNIASAQSYMRAVEGYGTQQDQKITTGVPINRTGVSDNAWSYIDIIGGTSGTQKNLAMVATAPGENYEVGQGSDLVLTTTIYPIISVRSGRWSDPGTWDEGRQPYSNENVEIRDIVYTGYDGNGSNVFGASPYSLDEEDIPGITGTGTTTPVLAKQVTIAPVSAQTRLNVALVIGNNDLADRPTLIFGNTIANGYGIINNNTATGSWDETWSGTGSTLHGLHVTNINGSNIPIMRASQISNSGTLINNSQVEIGE